MYVSADIIMDNNSVNRRHVSSYHCLNKIIVDVSANTIAWFGKWSEFKKIFYIMDSIFTNVVIKIDLNDSNLT